MSSYDIMIKRRKHDILGVNKVSILVIIGLVVSSIASLLAAFYYYLRASIFDEMLRCYDDVEKDNKKAETFGIVFIVLMFVADVVRISMKPIF